MCRGSQTPLPFVWGVSQQQQAADRLCACTEKLPGSSQGRAAGSSGGLSFRLQEDVFIALLLTSRLDRVELPGVIGEF